MQRFNIPVQVTLLPLEQKKTGSVLQQTNNNSWNENMHNKSYFIVCETLSSEDCHSKYVNLYVLFCYVFKCGHVSKLYFITKLHQIFFTLSWETNIEPGLICSRSCVTRYPACNIQPSWPRIRSNIAILGHSR